jgi:ribosomal protein S18 acetylase RimI-like enzyme
MADYYVSSDGSISTTNKKKKKRVDYVVGNDGKIKLNSVQEDIAPVKETVKKEDNKRSWFQGGAFSDGYQFGDVTKTILGSSADLKQDVSAGILGIVEKTIDTGAYGYGAFLEASDPIRAFGTDLFGLDEMSKEIREKDQRDEIQKFIEKDLIDEEKISAQSTNTGITGFLNNLLTGNMDVYEAYKNPLKDLKGESLTKATFEEQSVLGEKTDSLAQSGGQLAATVGLQAVGVPWFVTTGATSFGSGVEEAYNSKNGATHAEAGVSAGIKAGAEIAFEKLSGGIKFGGKTLDDVIGIKALADKIPNHIAQTLTKFGIDVFGEGGEEVLTEMAGNVAEKLTYEDEKTLKDIFFSKEAWNEYIEAFIGGAVLGGGVNVGKAVSSIQNKTDYDTGLTKAEEQTWKQETENSIRQLEEQGQTLTKKQKQNIEDTIKNDIIRRRNAQIPTQEDLAQVEGTVEAQAIEEQSLDEIIPVETQVEDTLQETQQISEELNEATNAQQITEEVSQEQATPDNTIKQKQLEIIQKNNPMTDDYHTGVRSVEDIKTYSEAVQEELDGEAQDLTPDFKKADLEKALETGKMTVYSSYPIEQGVFVTPSKMEAQSYAGSEKVYSQEINIDDVAWIDTIQGQYAKVENAQKTTENEKTSQKVEENAQNKAEIANVAIEDEVNDIHSGETFSTMSAKVNGEIVGTLEYGEYEGKPNVKMIEVQPEHRRQGIATKLLQELQKKYPEQEIDFGMSTEDGTNLLKNITYQVENKEYAKKQKELEEVNNKIQEYENSEPKKLTEEEIDEWNKLYDRQYILDKELFDLELDGQNTKKTFVKLDNQTTTQKTQVDTPTQQEANNQNEIVAKVEKAIEPVLELVNQVAEQVKTIQENITPITEVNNNDRISETNVSTETNQTTRGENQSTNEIKQYKQEVKKYIKNHIKESFGFKNKDVDDIYNKVVSKENPTIDDIYNAFEGHREIKVKPDETFIQEIKEIKSAIRNTRLQVSDDVRQITDWNAFRKSNFGSLQLTNDGIPIDSFYQELSNMYPGQFDPDIKTQADQLEALSDFMKSNTNTILNESEIYTLSDSDLSEVANYIYDGLQSVKSFEDSLQQMAPVEPQANIEETIAPVETAQNPFELTDEQNAKIQELRDDTKKWKEIYNERYDDKKFAQKRIKGVAMQNAAEIRNITQGDLLIPIEGGLTETELSNRIDKLRKNYIGKQVLVDGKEGTVVGNAYGKIGVEFTDGTKQYVDKNSIQPLEDIDSTIQEQQRMYDQYNIAPEPQTLQVDGSIPIKKTTPKKQNTELSDTSTETQEQAKIAEILSERPTQENKKQRLWAKFRAGILDKGSVVEDLSIRNKNRELMSKWDYMLTAEARAQSVMINGHRGFDSETKTETQTSKSLNDIQTEVGDKVQEFSEYLYHKHNISRMSLETKAQARMEELQATTLAEYDVEAIEKLSRKRITEKTNEETAELIETAKEYVRLSETKNKPVFGDSVTAEVSREIVNEYEMNNPEFMDWAKDVYDYNNANLDQLVQSGVISQETATQFAEMYPNYVPIGRAEHLGNAINVPLDTNRTTINTPIKGAKGGNGDILPLFDTMARRTMQTYRAVAKNNFGVELKNTLKGNTINQTTNVDEVLDNVDQQEGLLQEGKDGKAPTFTVFENGEKVTYEITQDIYEALKPVSDSSLLSTTFKPFNKISNFHRGVLTEYNPVFMITNFTKDIQDVLINSQHAAKTYAKIPEAFTQIIKKGYWDQEYMANGGEQNSYFDSQEGTFDTERKGISKVLDTFPLKQISQLNNIIEKVPRLAEYIASREAGRSVETSMLDAARVTTNFKAGGDLTKWANRNGATFLNASVQGAMQQVRNVREANMNGLKGYANLATKFALAGVPAMMLNALLWGDDEEYEELSDYVKQNYWIVGKYGDGNFIRIPKGRMVSVIQESFNQMKHLITGDGEADLGQFLEMMGNNIAPNNPIENNVLSPIIGAATNTTWYGDDLVPTRLQDEPTTEQFDESTDKLSIFLGEKLGISPYKINYVLDQYSGGIGDVFLPMMTQQAETGTDSLGENLIAPLTNKFTVDSVMKNQNVSDLYSKSEELTSKANSTSATDEDILQNKYLNSIKSEMNELYKEKREIQNSSLSDSEKYEQVREIQKEINNMARKAMDEYENINKTDNYATIGNKEYYMKKVEEDDGTIKETWNKVEDDELMDLDNLEMDIDDKSTYFNLKEQISGIKKQDLDPKITKSQISTAVRNADLTDKQKAYIYGKNYSSDETLDLVINSNIPFNEYLNFASQEFEADKYSNGKTVSGSRKKKVVSYINSLNLSVPQKAMLIRTEYPSFDDYNYEILDFVNGLNIVYEDKLSILDKLDFKLSENGYITW